MDYYLFTLRSSAVRSRAKRSLYQTLQIYRAIHAIVSDRISFMRLATVVVAGCHRTEQNRTESPIKQRAVSCAADPRSV